MLANQPAQPDVDNEMNNSTAMCESRRNSEKETSQPDTTKRAISPSERLVKTSKGDPKMNNAFDSTLARPDSTWTLDRLQEYALARANQISSWGRKTLVETWLFGSALALIRDKQKQEGKWMEWLKTQRISPPTATNAIKLSERISFEDLESCEGMTVSDLKAALDIIKQPPAKKRGKPVNTSTAHQQDADQPSTIPISQATNASVLDSSTTVTTKDASLAPATEKSAPEQANGHVTTTDYSRKDRRKRDELMVGANLTASEVLGQAFNLLLEAEKQGITPDCSDILNDLAAKVAALIQSSSVVAA